MPRKATSRSKKLYTDEDLQKAKELTERGWTMKRAAAAFNIPRTTFILHIKGWKNRQKTEGTVVGRPIELCHEVEEKLAKNIETMNKWGLGLSRKEILNLVHVYLTENNIPNRFKNSRPGKDWFIGFCKRWKLSCKKPIQRQNVRTQQTQPEIIFGFFDLLEETLRELELDTKPAQIFNLDETSICHDPKLTKVVATKNKSVFRSTYGSGRVNTSVLLCISAKGDKLPPYILFKAKHLWDTWMPEEAYPGTGYRATPNGWMTEDAFLAWFRNIFLKNCPKERPLLLIFDGHKSHVSIPLIELASQEQITLLKLPPHTTHLLQPLDNSVFNVFKRKWDEAVSKWQRENYGQPLGKGQFSVLLGKVWDDMTSDALKIGFELTGIYPINRNVIKDNIFDPNDLAEYKKIIENRFQETIHIAPSNNLIGSVTLSDLTSQSSQVLVDILPSNHNSPILAPHSASCSQTITTPGSDKANTRCETNNNSLDNASLVSFETLLLRKINNKENIPNKRSKVKSNYAEILTREEYLNDLKKKKKPEPKLRQQRIPSPGVESSDNSDAQFSLHDSDSSVGNLDLDLPDDNEPEFNNILKTGSWILVNYPTKKKHKKICRTSPGSK